MGNISLHCLFKEKDMALVERKIMLTHITNAMKLFLTMNIDVNNMSVAGVYIQLEFSWLVCT